jgi:hypothetical protein
MPIAASRRIHREIHNPHLWSTVDFIPARLPANRLKLGSITAFSAPDSHESQLGAAPRSMRQNGTHQGDR